MNATKAMSATVDGPPRPGLVLACVCACTVLVVGLVAAINLAVPQLAASGLHPGSAQLLWIVDAYVVVFACLVIPGGAAGDRFGRKGVLVAGLLTFAVGAAVSASSTGVGIMLGGRVVTGLGAALVLPNCVGVLVHATAPERRGRALATWGAVSGMGGVIGNIGGGALLTGGSWRTLFAVVAAIALGCALWVGLLVPRSDRASRALDPVGTALFVAAVVALLIGIIEGPEQGWGGAVVVTAFASAVVLGAAWVVFELRASHPLLDPRLFRIPLLSSAAFGMSVMFFGSFGLFYVNASLLQYGRGYSVLQAGLGALPLAAPLLLVSRFVPDLVRRVGIPITLSVAFPAIGTGLIGLSTATRQQYPLYAAWLVLVGIGFALALPCLTAELTAALPAEQAGVAGGLQSATRELGSALG
ncbi:MAG: MFS transporter, partial [Umezawaea sp.]